MTRTLRSCGAIIALGIMAFAAGCGETEGQPDDSSGTTRTEQQQSDQDSVPAGVVEQYSSAAEEIAAEGGETTSGPWRVAYIVEPAEPWYEPADGQQQFREPAPDETHHIEILPFEASTGRIVPQVPITLEVLDPNGRVVDTAPLNFYYSTFFHYANNFSVPDPGRYTLRATLGTPTFFRHGEADQEPELTQGATVEFTDVELTPEN
ncbi:hypothetical protein ACXN1G_04270 [Rhodococcus ruber]|uniref:Lipoprotein n=1 Tax=Rhodococcus rhodochrous KG-21 TaxID=1441923 RepID=A0A0M8PER8_RHORH|nr:MULTISPECIES: hypothetical protein [Rhodococcus]ATQ30799.1 hypothetical protein CS378_20060 [Rhodococcus ruber]KOS54876.1 hypothetical protein Z051_17865 [Rhodococcus rhodochrous KG-21]RQM33500.1 hypothetical protein TN91_14550 [Rhodococcus ruber]WKK11769.1 hypothetical protein QYN14_24340 [Rhodococcus ruber]